MIVVKDDPDYQDRQEKLTGIRPVSSYTVNGESITEDQLQRWRDDPGIEVLMVKIVRDWKGGGDQEDIEI